MEQGKALFLEVFRDNIPQDRGMLRFRGEELSSKSLPHERFKLGLGYLAQEPRLFWDLNCLDNLQACVDLAGVTKKPFELKESLKEVGLGDQISQKAKTLSGGERRRLELARTLLFEPKLILFDEPFAGLDPGMIQECINMILELKNKGVHIFVCDHQYQHIADVADRLMLLNQGKIVLSEKVDGF